MNSVRDWRGTPQGCSGAQRRNDNSGKPDRRLRRERPNEKITGVYMPNIGGIIKSLQNIMRKDQGVSGDAQRIEQLGWMVTLKILDDKEAELELLHDEYVSVMPEKLKWRSWAADGEGITGDEMKDFVDTVLFPGLQNLDVSTGNKRAVLLRDIFAGTNNYMKNGTIIRQVVNKLNEINFNASEDRHLFGDIYEVCCAIYRVRGTMESFTLRVL